MNKKDLLKLAQGPKTRYPRNKNVVDVFEEIVKKHPLHIALSYAKENLSYEELNKRSNKLARHLQKIGVKPQDYVGIYLERSIDLFVAILAILKAGAVYVPIDASYPLKRKLHMIEDTHLKVLITEKRFQNEFPQKIQILLLNNLSLPYETTNLRLKINPLDLAYINYTSGTTGNPKGVQIPHRGILHLVKNSKWNHFSHKDRFLQISNISFDPLTQELWGSLLNGATLCIYPETDFSPHTLGKFIIKEKISQIVITSRVFTLMVEEALDCFKNVSYVGVGGDILSAKHAKMVIQKFPSCHVINEYGPIENTTCSTAHRVSLEDGQILPIGKPIDNTTAYILDENQNLMKFGETGELYLGGDGLARGYLNRPDLTEEKFIPNPFGKGKLYRTGDLARYLPSGNLLFLGRIDTQVKIRGFRIELGEVEEVLRSHPSVGDCVALVSENRPGEKKLIAYIEPHLGKEISYEKLRLFASEHLPSHAIPQIFVNVEKFPITPNGKIDKGALPLPIQGEIKEGSTKTKTEKTLQAIWASVLHLQTVDRKDNFFDIGGDSIQAMHLNAKARKALNLDIPVRLIFERTTLEKYAASIDKIKTHGKSKTSLEIPFASFRKKEALLDLKISAKKILPVHLKQYTKPKKIFLTGATGLVGSFFLRHLILHTKAHIYCLVRGKSEAEGKEHLIQMCTRYRFWQPQYQKRFTILIGSLEEPLLGLGESTFQTLGKEIDSIFHIGAFVNHAMGYEQHKGANVLGTQEILRLSCTHRLKPVHLISSLSVLEGIPKDPISEDVDIEQSKTLSNGYAESKWVSEKLVLIGRSRGIPCNIFRLPRVGGDSRIGSGPTEDFLWRFVRAALVLQKAPKIDLYDDLTPVDYICKAIHFISTKPKWINSQFHVISPYPLPYAKIFKFLRKQGYLLEWTDEVSWKKELLAQAAKTNDPNLQALGALFAETGEEKPIMHKFSCNHLDSALKNSHIRCPKVDSKLLTKYIDYYVQTHFFPQPDCNQKSTG